MRRKHGSILRLRPGALVRARRAAFMSQRGLAHHLHCSVQHVGALETGRRGASTGMVEEISTILHVAVEKLVITEADDG